MKTHFSSKHVNLFAITVVVLFALVSQRLEAFPVITNVVETGGENQSGDTVTAKWTGVTWTDHAANEPVNGLAAGAPYTVGLFGNWAPGFVDRNHRYTNASTAAAAVQVPLPPYLVGQEYIMSGNDNRGLAAYRLDVFVNQNVVVYMLIDNRLGAPNSSNADPPSFGPTKMQWILDEGWTPVTNGINRTQNMNVPDEVGFDEAADNDHDQWFSVYSKLVTTGSFQLKQPDNDGQNMYGVVVVPASPPPVPADLTATGGDMKVTLNWSVSAGANSYIIKRSTISGGPYENIATNSANRYLDTGLVNGVIYYYVVSAVGSGGESANSSEVVATPKLAPVNVVATGGTNQVQLTWDAFAGAVSYTVKRSATSGGPYSTVASGVLSPSYLDAMLQSGRTYYYVVIAQLAVGESGVSDEAAGTTAPGAPTGLTASLWAATAIRLAWTAADPVITGFSIERSTDGINYSPLATVPSTPRNYVDAGLSASTSYYYRVQASNGGGNSDYSNVASNTTPAVGWNVNFANATNGTPANNPAPTPPGYVQDVGEAYGDRLNGYNYGWDRDITVDSRWRMAANSPDLRYDTFNHLIKATPPAIWEIEIPNGYYFVHIVAGDPSNTDSVFQFDVEGALTGTVTPGGAGSFLNNWADFTLTTCVSDGRLTVRSGPNSQTLVNNNKINFIDIYPAVPVAVGIDQQPQPQTLLENRPLVLSVTVTNAPPPPNASFFGSQPIVYQWYRDDIPVPTGTNATLNISLAQTNDSGNYYLIVMNCAGSSTSQVAAVTVNEDLVLAQVVSVGSVDGTSIGVCFDELMDAVPQFNPNFDTFSYHINGDIQSVTNVTMRPDGRSVRLDLAAAISGSFTVFVEAARDAAGNEGSAGTVSGTVAGFTAMDVGAPAQAGSTYSCKSGDFDVIAGGADIWGMSDQGHLTLMSCTGDWDMRVQIAGLTPANAISKAGLMARESVATNSRALYISVNPPPPGRDQGEAGMRVTTGGATAAWTSSTNYIPAGIPNAWQRMTRFGNTFTAYRSTNGVNWIPFATTTQPFPSTLLLGFGTTAHDNAVGPTTALYRNFRIICQPVLTNLSYSAATSTFTFSFATQSGSSYVIEYKDSLSAPSWTLLTTVTGDGTVKLVSDTAATGPMRFYRARIE